MFIPIGPNYFMPLKWSRIELESLESKRRTMILAYNYKVLNLYCIFLLLSNFCAAALPAIHSSVPLQNPQIVRAPGVLLNHQVNLNNQPSNQNPVIPSQMPQNQTMPAQQTSATVSAPKNDFISIPNPIYNVQGNQRAQPVSNVVTGQYVSNAINSVPTTPSLSPSSHKDHENHNHNHGMKLNHSALKVIKNIGQAAQEVAASGALGPGAQIAEESTKSMIKAAVQGQSMKSVLQAGANTAVSTAVQNVPVGQLAITAA